MKQVGALGIIGGAVLTGGVVAIVCAGALAAVSVKTGTYQGRVTGSSTEKVSFEVKGGTVANVKVTPFVPNKCGAGGTPPQESSVPATIKNGRFTAKLSEETVNGAVSGTATVNGRFLAGGKVVGLVKNPLPGAKECAGNFPYTAKVGKR